MSVCICRSPAEILLESLEDVRQYLLTEGTCKCGLQCPLIVEKTFVFDVSIPSRHMCIEDVRGDSDMTNLCNHRRKLVAMAAFQQSAELQLDRDAGGTDPIQFKPPMSYYRGILY